MEPPRTGKGGVMELPDGACYDDQDNLWECDYCNGEGEVMVCFDDICQGSGYCFHGDGYVTCPKCKGSGEAK